MKTTTLTRKRGLGSTDAELLRARMGLCDPIQAPAEEGVASRCASGKALGRLRRGVGLGISILISLGLWALIALGAAMLFR